VNIPEEEPSYSAIAGSKKDRVKKTHMSVAETALVKGAGINFFVTQPKSEGAERGTNIT